MDPTFVGASVIPIPRASTKVSPRPLTLDKIKQYTQDFATAASNAVHLAGFLIDQFLQNVSNDWTDAYSGSIENRARFGLEPKSFTTIDSTQHSCALVHDATCACVEDAAVDGGGPYVRYAADLAHEAIE